MRRDVMIAQLKQAIAEMSAALADLEQQEPQPGADTLWTEIHPDPQPGPQQ